MILNSSIFCIVAHIRFLAIPEALPGIVAGFTVTIVTMINSSAIAGAIGAGGLGDIAYRYGYQRFDDSVIYLTVIVLIILVQIVQSLGEWLSRLR